LDIDDHVLVVVLCPRQAFHISYKLVQILFEFVVRL